MNALSKWNSFKLIYKLYTWKTWTLTVSAHTCLYKDTCIQKIYTHTWVNTCTCTCRIMLACTCTLHIYKRTNAETDIQICIYACICVYVCSWIHVPKQDFEAIIILCFNKMFLYTKWHFNRFSNDFAASSTLAQYGLKHINFYVSSHGAFPSRITKTSDPRIKRSQMINTWIYAKSYVDTVRRCIIYAYKLNMCYECMYILTN